jgi:uncharacterized protein
MRRIAIAVVMLGALTLAVVALLPRRQTPIENWWIHDDAHLLTPAEELRLTRYHAALVDASDIDLRILTVDGAADIDGLAADAFERLGVGHRSRAGRGLLLVVDGSSERVRLEVARALEGQFPDAFVARIERDQMAPFFAAGRVADGILATTELLVARAAGTDDFASSAGAAASSVGAGAVASTPIASGYERPEAPGGPAPTAGSAPETTVASYLAMMNRHDGTADLDLYTLPTREMLASRVVTVAQMDNLVRSYEGCENAQVLTRLDHAVIRYRDTDPGCAPWLLERGADGLWRLDLATMSEAIRFDIANRWTLADPDAAADYAFGFE